MSTPLPSEDWPHEIEDPVWFKNDQWAVTGFGLESVDPHDAYEVGKDQLLNTHWSNGPDTSAILEHVGSKRWVRPALLAEAFRKAIEHHHPGQSLPFDLELCIARLLDHPD